MMHQSYKHRGARSRGGIGGVILCLIVIGFGGFLVFQLIGWFRTTNENAAITQATTLGVATLSAPVVLDGSASITGIDGGLAGVVYRRGSAESAEYNAVLNLPTLIVNTSYEVWMVKDGLADVQSAGILETRADGTFAKVFSVSNPIEYPNVVIMVEPNDGVSTPSGNIVAQGRFTDIDD